MTPTSPGARVCVAEGEGVGGCLEGVTVYAGVKAGVSVVVMAGRLGEEVMLGVIVMPSGVPVPAVAVEAKGV